MQLTDKCSLWRMKQQPNGTIQLSVIIPALPCLRVPQSKFDKIASALSAANSSTIPSEFTHTESRQSQAIFLIPDWADIRPEDELQRGRYTNNAGQVVPFRYIVDGIQDYGDFGYQNVKAVYTMLGT